jgi:hypothetical protein
MRKPPFCGGNAIPTEVPPSYSKTAVFAEFFFDPFTQPIRPIHIAVGPQGDFSSRLLHHHVQYCFQSLSSGPQAFIFTEIEMRLHFVGLMTGTRLLLPGVRVAEVHKIHPVASDVLPKGDGAGNFVFRKTKIPRYFRPG